MLAAYLITTYYSVIAGWTMVYVWRSGSGQLGGLDAAATAAAFEGLLADPLQLTAWHGGFMLITAAILGRGLKRGLEKAVTVLLPALFILLLLLVTYSAITGDMPTTLRFLFQFDLAAIDVKVVLMAIGQAFFSIGVAMGLMLGFGAYLGEDISIARSAVIIVSADTLVALLAGLAIFPIVFAHGLDPSEGPGLVFVSLPMAFGHMPAGLVFGTLFFLLLFFAALTSVIGVLEPVVAWLEEASRLNRRMAVGVVCASVFMLGLGTVFSFNIWSHWHPLGFFDRFSGAGFFELLDYLTANIMMPLGGMLLALFAGWMIPRAELVAQSNIGNRRLFAAWYGLLRWLVPAAILAVFVANL
jgi:NSS family neurotransmitter:Na+ symporter